MDFEAIMEQAAAMQEAYSSLSPHEQAQKINDAFAHQPIIGWLLLDRLGKRNPTGEGDRGNG